MSDLNPQKPAGDSRTIIAVVLSVIIITGGVFINEKFFPKASAPAPVATTSQPAATTAQAPAAAASPAASSIRASDAPLPAVVVAPLAPVAPLVQTAPTAVETTTTVNTDLFEAIFTNRGGNLISLKLKKHKDVKDYVDLVLQSQENKNALTVAFGGKDAPAIDAIMDVKMLDATTIEFSKTFLADVPGKSSPVPFFFRKTFTFKDGEYLFGLNISLENSVNEYLPLDKDGYAYTLSFAPQIGPHFNPLSKNSDYRTIIDYTNGKKHDQKPKATPWTLKDQASWIGISGKYFAFMAIPELQTFTTTLTSANVPQLGQTTRMDFSRPAVKTSTQSDGFWFYFGPKTSAELKRYNYADGNAFKKSGLNLEAATSAGVLTWLENILKFFLNIFYKVIPNYGVAIVLVTILVKVVLFPLTKKGSMSSAHMQELQPKIQALQAKYKGNPEKLNKEMAEFYKTEGMNPMAGCLPLLIQFPIFIAMYNLFNTHFDLRGALFIPGWIPDLSMPESVWSFAPFTLPLLHWTDLRLLPVIYLLSQLFYGKFTQQPSTGQSATQMKIMMFGMPIVFFFILYDVPSGLLVYWIASNLLTIVQQLVINDILRKRKKGLVKAK